MCLFTGASMKEEGFSSFAGRRKMMRLSREEKRAYRSFSVKFSVD